MGVLREIFSVPVYSATGARVGDSPLEQTPVEPSAGVPVTRWTQPPGGMHRTARTPRSGAYAGFPPDPRVGALGRTPRTPASPGMSQNARYDDTDPEIAHWEARLRQLHAERADELQRAHDDTKTALDRELAAGMPESHPLVAGTRVQLAEMLRHVNDRRLLAAGKPPLQKYTQTEYVTDSGGREHEEAGRPTGGRFTTKAGGAVPAPSVGRGVAPPPTFGPSDRPKPPDDRHRPPTVAGGDDPLVRTPGLTPQQAHTEEAAQHYVREHYPRLRNEYLHGDPARGIPGQGTFDEAGNLLSVSLNTDEWRPLIPGYVGTNAGETHEAASWLNKQLTAEVMNAQRGKGNNTFMVLAGGGGCHEIDAPIMMFDGSVKKVQDVAVGDKLMGPDSKPRTVQVLHRGTAPMYRIVPKKGEPFVVNGDHVLSLHGVTRNRNKSRRRDYTLDITVDDVLKRGKRFLGEFFLYRAAVDFPSSPVKLDPYFLGVWLGDGTNCNTHVTSADPEIAEFLGEFVKRFPALKLTIRPKRDNKASRYEMTLRTQTRRSGDVPGIIQNPITVSLERIGVLRNKHIPREYLINDRKTRLELLAGLLDTDGHLNTNGGFGFISKHERLARQVEHLARSLGFSAYMNPCRKSWTWKGVKNTSTYYRLEIYGDLTKIPTKIARKKSGPRATHYRDGKRTRNVLHTGFRIEPVGVGDYYGFTLDGDGLYLMGDFTVTHNSGKGTAVGDFFVQADYPIVLDQVSDRVQKLIGKLDEAKRMGYDTSYVFVDRPPAGAAQGVIGRAVNLREQGKLARTVHLPTALKANIDARRTALELLKSRPDIPVAVIDNRGAHNGNEFKRRLIRDRDEAVTYLEERLAEDEREMAGGLEQKVREHVLARHAVGEIDPDLLAGFLGPGAAPTPPPTGAPPPLPHARYASPAVPRRWLPLRR